MILNFRVLRPTFSTSKLFSRPYFLNVVASRVLNFTYLFTMIQCAHVGEILHSPDGVEEVESPLPGILWSYASYGSFRVHTDAIITITPKSKSLHFGTTLQNSYGDVLVTLYPYFSVISHLVEVNEIIIQTCSSCHELFRPFSYNQQRDRFHTIAVGVRQFIRHQFIIGIFPNRIKQ